MIGNGPARGRERIAAAPISWGVCEVPGWGHQMSTERVLGEMRDLGLSATEAGPDGFLPSEASRLCESLDRYGLRLVGGFLPLVLHGDRRRWRPPLDGVARRFAAAGGEVVVLAAATGLAGYDARSELTAEEWGRLCAALDEAARLVAGRGLRAVLHPHVGTVVERPDEIARVLGGSSISLCVDTGHIMAGGGDPVTITRQAPERVGHVHVKDVRAELARLVAEGKLPYSDAVRDGLFCPLGDGDIDVPALVEGLGGAGYDGWYVLEQDVMLDAEPPGGHGPRGGVGQSAAYLRSLL
ncbi:MAG: TIM barrel protein [Streptosporangiaceae bacterium]